MSESRQPTTARAIVEDVFSPKIAREIWTANYEDVLPLSIQDFDLSAVLPAIFYMFRFGHRRGKGRFLETFGGQEGRRRDMTIERVAKILADEETFDGFEDEATKAILGDLLLSFCLENRKRDLGQQKQIQRVAPAHYMASWIDLPDAVAHLRYAPEMITAILADQGGESVQINQAGAKSSFTVGQGYEDNVLLKAFHQGMVREGLFSGNRAADRFQEDVPVGLDQLLMIRLAQKLEEPPEKLRGTEGQISNQRPIAEQAARDFSEDMRRFVRTYAEVLPRHAFVELLESCMAVGLTTIVTSVLELLFEWAESGVIRQCQEQQPSKMFVDCSGGLERGLRSLAEQSMDDFLRRSERFPTILMALRLLDQSARINRKLKDQKQRTRPYATEWVNLLGDLLHDRHKESRAIQYSLDEKAGNLAERLEEEYPEAAKILDSEEAEPNPVWRVAETLTFLQGRKNTQTKFVGMMDSVLMISQPNGLAIKRSVIRQTASGVREKREARSLVLSDAVLDYLVHLHVLLPGNKEGHQRLSLKSFIRILRERYGFCIDQAPPGLPISNDELQRNRFVLERRLRDLGLLVGVNDAEAMKHLKPRFERSQEDGNGLD